MSLGILLIFGISVFGGILSAFIVKKIRVPQVIGYIITGIIIGESGFKLVNSAEIARLAPFNFFALGIIGFLVGAEIKLDTMKKYGRQFLAILLAEGLLSFTLVGIATGSILFFLTDQVSVSVAGGIIFGAIASATDPASTLNVLQEYKTAGILTTTVIAIVALDDALAMTLYGLGTGVAQMLSGSDVVGYKILFTVLFELGCSIAIGATFGYIINYILRSANRHESSAATSFGLLLLCIGIAQQLEMDVILATMAAGILVINKSPKRSHEIIQYIKNLSIPIYVMFFVLVGARLQLNNLPNWLWLLILFYTLFRSIGKYLGSWFGATITGSQKTVRHLTGLSLFSQGGVAIGLSIMASHHLNQISVTENYLLGDVIIFGITATTFMVQIIGPACVKLAAGLANERGKDVSREDILERTEISGVLQRNIPVITESTTLKSIFKIFSGNPIDMMPVIGKTKKLLGCITINQLRQAIVDRESWDWLLASDLMAPVNDKLNQSDSLYDGMSMMEQLQRDYVAVTDQSNRFVGIITKQKIKEFVNHEQLKLINV